MATLVPFVLLFAFLFHVQATHETLTSLDASFCHGELEVVYPELAIDKCLMIKKNLRKKVSIVWKAPRISFAGAQKKKTYVLVMVDPDAPIRTEQTSAYWRHWLVVGIQGNPLKKGQIKGKTLTEYYPPTPPQKTGLHRYQFMLFEQPPDAPVSLSQREKSSRGKWDLQAFITRFALGEPVAQLQFLTQNYKD